MKNKYELITNLNKETKKVYENHFLSEGYQLLINETNIIFAKKEYNGNINLEHEKQIVKLIESMISKYKTNGILYIDLSNEMNSILQQIENEKVIKLTDNRICWPIRQAIIKAIASEK